MRNDAIVNRDSDDLQKFGYQQDLKRSLGGFSAFAAGFSYISILTGLFQMFYLGFGAAGPAFFWSWPIVFVGHLLIALCFAEVSAHYPLSGGVYQWSKYLGTPFMGWMTGWIYFACLVVTLAAVALAMQNSLPQIWEAFQFVKMSNEAESYAINAVLLGCFFLTISTLINCAGVKLISIINNVGVFAELIGLVVLIILLALHAVRDPLAATTVTLSKGNGHSFGYLGPFLAGTALTASYVMYGYDTAGSLAEET
ncbi:MAG: amino acid permease, partial [Bdellovibrionia bacterium]